MVPWHAFASDWIGASRMAGTRRSLHIFAPDRPLHCGYLGGNRFHSHMALSTDGARRCCSNLSWCCCLQTSYWRDSETLFTHALAVTRNNDVAMNNLGIIFLEKGQLDDAISNLQAAIDVRPENGPAHDNL